jgi:ABC-type polysaccharide/polyol phosphate transport system ATPase subunit
MKPILEIQHISKKFKIHHEQQPYLSLRDSLSSVFKVKNSTQNFWALNDVSFNVEKGDTIGIIGKNGAGKSTLLKILSRITPPTTGKIICRGRIASLLEVGTGFHPELSGRENVFMNGSILGMRRAEILNNFDAIIEFAGIDKFVDTPLKHYSSGMQLRLAFAVAAFLQNEILIIDEVLAVGDAEFQKKCMGKMGDISQSGRTILFVSHNMHALNQLCKRSVMLEKGQVQRIGDTHEIIDYYNSKDVSHVNSDNQELNMGSNLLLCDLNIDSKENGNYQINFNVKFKESDVVTSLVLLIHNSDGFRVAIIDCRNNEFPIRGGADSGFKTTIHINKLPFVEGDYYLGAYVESNFFKGNVENILRFNPQSKKVADESMIEYPKKYRGVIELSYQVEYKIRVQ